MKQQSYLLASATAVLIATLVLTAGPGRAGDDETPRSATPPDAKADGDKATDASDVAEYVEYRSMPDLGQIQISGGVVRGRHAAARLREHPEDFAKRGIFACTDHAKRHVYRRTETMSGHKVETLLTIEPPAKPEKPGKLKQDDEDDTWVRHLVVLIDGKKKVSCSLGDSPTVELTVFGLSIFPEDATIEASAADLEGREMFVPEEAGKFDSADVITDDAFEEDEPADEMPEQKGKTVDVMFRHA
jgi:hypothetical protein